MGWIAREQIQSSEIKRVTAANTMLGEGESVFSLLRPTGSARRRSNLHLLSSAPQGISKKFIVQNNKRVLQRTYFLMHTSASSSVFFNVVCV